MSDTSNPYFFISYSREDTVLQQKVIRGLRSRGLNVWVDTENLVPGSPEWERIIERAIRGAAGVVVLLSPNSNNSEWVRREISFAESNKKHIFPALIHGNENDSIPLRLSAHQRIDLRNNFDSGLDQLNNFLRDFLGATLITKRAATSPVQFDFRKLVRPAMFGVLGLAAIGCIFLTFNLAGDLINNTGLFNAGATPTIETVSGTVTTNTTKVTNDEPTGRIVYTCQVQGDEVCIIDANGSGWKRLTDSQFAAFNATLSPDGQSVVYVIADGNSSEVHELNVNSGTSTQITFLGEFVGSPEISPDNRYILFHHRIASSNLTLWIMDRDGNNAREFLRENGRDVHDGTWSPDGSRILFAMGKGENNKLYTVDFNGGESQLLNNDIDTRGRSDWGIGDSIVLDMGEPFAHEVFFMYADGSQLHQISSGGMNSQGASISPDGKWITFTAYTNVAGQDLNSCEIFIMRLDGSDIRQLTDNTYCDYQPRWGN